MKQNNPTVCFGRIFENISGYVFENQALPKNMFLGVAWIANNLD